MDIKNGEVEYSDLIKMNDYLLLKQDLEEEAIERSKKKENE